MDFWMNMFMLIIFIITLPLHLIPILGTIAFCYINGLFLAWGNQQPYFHAFGVPWQQQWNSWVSPHKSDYFAFGFSAQLLNLIPVVNFLFIFTNFVGAAIWVLMCERERRAKYVIDVLVSITYRLQTNTKRA